MLVSLGKFLYGELLPWGFLSVIRRSRRRASFSNDDKGYIQGAAKNVPQTAIYQKRFNISIRNFLSLFVGIVCIKMKVNFFMEFC